MALPFFFENRVVKYQPRHVRYVKALRHALSQTTNRYLTNRVFNCLRNSTFEPLNCMPLPAHSLLASPGYANLMPFPPRASTSVSTDHQNTILASGVHQPVSDSQPSKDFLPMRSAHGVVHRITEQDLIALKGYEVGYKVRILEVSHVGCTQCQFSSHDYGLTHMCNVALATCIFGWRGLCTMSVVIIAYMYNIYIKQ